MIFSQKSIRKKARSKSLQEGKKKIKIIINWIPILSCFISKTWKVGFRVSRLGFLPPPWLLSNSFLFQVCGLAPERHNSWLAAFRLRGRHNGLSTVWTLPCLPWWSYYPISGQWWQLLRQIPDSFAAEKGEHDISDVSIILLVSWRFLMYKNKIQGIYIYISRDYQHQWSKMKQQWNIRLADDLL